MESENSSFIDKISSQPPLAVATQQGRKDVIKACVALSFDMISMMRIFTRKSTPLERSRIRQHLETDAFLNRGIRQFLFSKTSRELDIVAHNSSRNPDCVSSSHAQNWNWPFDQRRPTLSFFLSYPLT